MSCWLWSCFVFYITCSRVCGNSHGLIRKYGLMCCRQCFHSNAKEIGFIKVIIWLCCSQIQSFKMYVCMFNAFCFLFLLQYRWRAIFFAQPILGFGIRMLWGGYVWRILCWRKLRIVFAFSLFVRLYIVELKLKLLLYIHCLLPLASLSAMF